MFNVNIIVQPFLFIVNIIVHPFLFIVNIIAHPVLCSSIVKLLFVHFNKFTPYYPSWSHLHFISIPRCIVNLKPYLPEWCIGIHVHIVCFAILCGLQFLAYSLGVELSHTPLLHWDSPWVSLHWQQSCNWTKCPLIHSLPYPGIHFWSYVERVPLDARVSCVQRAYFAISKVCSTLHLSRKWCTNKLE